MQQILPAFGGFQLRQNAVRYLTSKRDRALLSSLPATTADVDGEPVVVFVLAQTFAMRPPRPLVRTPLKPAFSLTVASLH